MNKEKNIQLINQLWEKQVLPTLIDYIKIPCKSPQFDRDWQEHGYMEQAVTLLSNWCKSNAIPTMKLDVIRSENRTPLIFIDIPAQQNQHKETVLLYGHLDKQPEMRGWDADLSPWKPVIRGDRLYGRGSADDGYAVFSALAAITSLHNQQIPHARCVILIEASEESGSPDLPFYMDLLKDRMGQPSLIICLDSGCGNYDQLWATTSLRGLIGGKLSIKVLKQGVHSGLASGVVPSCFRILRQLLNRVENETTGDIILSELFTTIPQDRIKQAERAAKFLGKAVITDLPFISDMQTESSAIAELILRRTWKPALSIVGCEGIPDIQNAGNVTLPEIAVKLSLRLPPTCDHHQAIQVLKSVLEKDPPYHAQVNFDASEANPGWNAPAEQAWLSESINRASQDYFNKEACYIGEGGSIPFMGMLGKKFPKAQFLITGLLGPESNAHGPNEFLHIPTWKKLTASIAQIIADHSAVDNPQG